MLQRGSYDAAVIPSAEATDDMTPLQAMSKMIRFRVRIRTSAKAAPLRRAGSLLVWVVISCLCPRLRC